MRRTARTPARVGGALLVAAFVLSACARDEAPTHEPSFLLVSVDTLRADALGCYASERRETPAIDSLAERSLVFDAAYTTATQTAPAMTSVLTGLLPPRHGVVVQMQRLRPEVRTLAALLADAGWSTGAFVANLGPLMEIERTAWSDGFETKLSTDNSSAAQWEWDRDATTACLEWITAVDAPYFAWLHLMDPHSEYLPPPAHWDYDARPLPDKLEQARLYSRFEKRGESPPVEVVRELHQIYAAQVAGIDDIVRRALEFVDTQPTSERPVLVFTSDHGEELFESWPKAGHGFSLTESVLHVPLMIAGNGIVSRRSGEVVSTLSVTPTLLELAGVASPVELDGSSLFSAAPNEGLAISLIGTRATARRADLRWWGQVAFVGEPPSIERYREAQPQPDGQPWHDEAWHVARFESDAPHTPVWLDRSSEATKELSKSLFGTPVRDRLRRGGSASDGGGATLDDAELEERLRELGYL